MFTCHFVQIYRSGSFIGSHKKTISLSVNERLVAIFDIPQDDYFHSVHSLDPGHLIYPNKYLQIPHSDNLAYIYITCGVGRTVEMKKDLYAFIAEKLMNRHPLA